MEAYPPEYVEHNLPLVVLSGLGEQQNDAASRSDLPRQESGTKLQTNLPECEGEQANQLLRQFLEFDGTNQPWNASALPGPSGVLKYRIKTIGRTFTLPNRKAAPLPQPTSPDGLQNVHGSPPRTELHSPLSPLSPGSPVFPDGVLSPLWFSKHQQQVPSIFIAVFEISASGDSSQDEQLKNDINAIRTSLSRSGFKTKFSAVLISDGSILHAPGLEERLSSIRRLTSLDSKTGLFFMPPMSSPAEIATFTQSVMTTLQPLCVEYYRDLTKHARRKKARAGSQPSVSSAIGPGTQALSTPGWNVRYEVKQGVFAEFRQEMDVADRHYSAAIDELFNAEGIFEATPSWSPRWEEARLLCDSLALRIVRCQLWNSSTTGAAQSWFNYKARMKDLLDRRAKGSDTYGWDAWESRWCQIMAQLIQRAEVPAFRSPSKLIDESTELPTQQVYTVPEKAFATVERLSPFHNLHHAGYWYRNSVRASQSRWKKALAIPEEDRVPPGQSPASAVAGRSKNYDFYLVPEPHEEFPLPGKNGHDHLNDISRLTKGAWTRFQVMGQSRMADAMKLTLAYDLVEAERYTETAEILIPVWQETSWRDEDWHDVFAELLLLLRRCAIQENDPDSILNTAYELLSIQSPLPAALSLDLVSCLQDLHDGTTKLEHSFQDNERLSPVALAFAFDSKEAYVGDSIGCQLSLVSRLNAKAKSLTLSSITLTISRSKTVTIMHDAESSTSGEDLVDLFDDLETTDSSRVMKANLTMNSSDKCTFNFTLLLREAEIIRLENASIAIDAEHFKIEHKFTDQSLFKADSILIKTNGSLQHRSVQHNDSLAVMVLPKPPKVRIVLNGLRKQYYTDEIIRLGLEAVNDETDAIEGKATAHMSDEADFFLPMEWTDENVSSEFQKEFHYGPAAPAVRSMSLLQPGSLHRAKLLFKAPPDPCKTTIIISIDYTLSADYSTPLRKEMTLDLNFVVPLEAKFSFGPQLYQEPWPSYFNPNDKNTNGLSAGLPQLWRLSSQVRSLATEKIKLQKVDLVVENIIGDSEAKSYNTDPVHNETVEAGQITYHEFELRTEKHSLDDRRPTTIESTLAISWSHADSDDPVTTHIPVPRLTLPVSEPRVLCTVIESATSDCDAIAHYHIENPSTHFLTFAITMDASEDFGFSGPKYRTLSLAPLSRHRVEYRIVLHDEDGSSTKGRWIWPSLQVIDSYYQKNLRIHPGGPDVKFDDKQNIGIWIGSP